MDSQLQIHRKNHERIQIQPEKDIEEERNVKFEIKSRTIDVPYLNLIRYSRVILDELIKNDIFSQYYTLLKETQAEMHIDDESIVTFFRLLNNEEVELKEEEFTDLMNLTNLFKVEPLEKLLKKYMENHKSDIDFILSLKIAETRNKNSTFFIEDEFSNAIEDCLSDKINECLKNEKIKQIPVSSIYRIIKQSSLEKVSCDLLYNFIKESIAERYVLFQFIELERMSDENIDDICFKYKQAKEEGNTQYYDYFSSNLLYINEMRKKQKSLEETIEQKEKKYKEEIISKVKEIEELKKSKEEVEMQQQQNIYFVKFLLEMPNIDVNYQDVSKYHIF